MIFLKAHLEQHIRGNTFTLFLRSTSSWTWLYSCLCVSFSPPYFIIKNDQTQQSWQECALTILSPCKFYNEHFTPSHHISFHSPEFLMHFKRSCRNQYILLLNTSACIYLIVLIYSSLFFYVKTYHEMHISSTYYSLSFEKYRHLCDAEPHQDIKHEHRLALCALCIHSPSKACTRVEEHAWPITDPSLSASSLELLANKDPHIVKTAACTAELILKNVSPAHPLFGSSHPWAATTFFFITEIVKYNKWKSIKPKHTV